MKTYGMTKSIDFEGDKIILKASVALLPLYKSLFGRDLIDATMDYFRNSSELAENEELIKKLSEKSSDEITEGDIKQLDSIGVKFDSEYIVQLLCALMLNAVPERERPPMPEALDIVPPGLVFDANVLSEAIGMLTRFINVKKN